MIPHFISWKENEGHSAQRDSLDSLLKLRKWSWESSKSKVLEFAGQNIREENAAQKENSGTHTGLRIVPVPIRVEILIIHRSLEYRKGNQFFT